MKMRLIAASLILAVPVSAIAGPLPNIRPAQIGSETLRYNRGVATVELSSENGAVHITPIGFDHGGMSFAVAVFNAGDKPANIDITDFKVSTASEPLRVLSAGELVKKAQNRAMWTQIGIALLTGVAAGLESSQRDYYRSTYRTPSGTYRYRYSAPSVSGQIAAASTIAVGAYSISRVQNQLDDTTAGIGANALQLTTVDPGDSYAGRIVLTKAKKTKLPATLNIVINWNGKDYPFSFEVGGTGPAPIFRQVPVVAMIGPNAPGASETASAPAPAPTPQPVRLPIEAASVH